MISESECKGLIQTLKLLSKPELKEKPIDGKNTLLEECVPEDKVEWERHSK